MHCALRYWNLQPGTLRSMGGLAEKPFTLQQSDPCTILARSRMWVELGSSKSFSSSFLAIKKAHLFYSNSVWNLRATCLSALILWRELVFSIIKVEIIKAPYSIVFTKISRFFSAENVAPHGSDAIFKLVNVSYAPPNCTEPLVKGEGFLFFL